MNCCVGSVYGELRDRPGVRFYGRLDCKRMSCAFCGPKKARQYQRAIARVAEANGLTKFLTLTLDPSRAPGPEASVDYIRQCFNKFRTYLRRLLGSAVTYIAVLELQKSGMAHLHVLLGRYIPKAQIDHAWAAVGGGFTWIKQVDVHRVSAYMSKYLTKDLFVDVPSKKKRISTSRGIRLFQNRERLGWSMDFRSLAYHLRKLVWAKGKIVSDLVHDETGLKSFNVVAMPNGGLGVFDQLVRFFENPEAMIKANG